MTDEQLIADGALKRAKDIIDNKDFWSGPGPAKTSSEAVVVLLGVADCARQIGQAKSAEAPAPKPEARAPRQPQPKEATTPAPDAKPESAEA